MVKITTSKRQLSKSRHYEFIFLHHVSVCSLEWDVNRLTFVFEHTSFIRISILACLITISMKLQNDKDLHMTIFAKSKTRLLINRILLKEIRSIQWLISEESRQTGLKTGSVPPLGFQDCGLWNCREMRTGLPRLLNVKKSVPPPSLRSSLCFRWCRVCM